MTLNPNQTARAVHFRDAKADGFDRADWHAVAVLHVRDGKFSECWIHVDDQYALDDFLNSLVA